MLSSRKGLVRAAEKSQGQTVLLELVSFCETQAKRQMNAKETQRW